MRKSGRGLRTHLVRVGLARRAFKLSGGRSRVVRVALTRRGRQLSAGPGSLAAQLVVAIPGGRRVAALRLR